MVELDFRVKSRATQLMYNVRHFLLMYLALYILRSIHKLKINSYSSVH